MQENDQNSGLDRRAVLRGLGAAVAVPAFESLMPARALAAAASGAGAPAQATTATGAPLRMAYVYFPNGVIADKWDPKGEGENYGLNLTTAPLAPHKSEFQMLSNFEQYHGWSNGDGGGDHARANSTFLTGAHAYKTAGSDIKLGISVDQIAAREIGHLTRFASLELSCDGVRKAGGCDSGYSCAYQYNISWRSATTPMTPEANPRLVFERLFGEGRDAAERQRNFQARNAQQKSILDFIRDDAAKLNKQLGHNDQQKLEEYLSGVREIEKRIEKGERFGQLPDPGVPSPPDTPEDYGAHIRLMYDLMALAFQTDSTRIATFMLAHDGSNRSFSEIGVPEGHHTLSHHRRDQSKMDKIAKIDRFYTEQFAYFLQKMRDTRDVDGKSLLHNSMIVYGGGLKDADHHQHDKLPIILAGHGGGALTPGRHVKFPGDTPLTNLYLTMVDKMGVAVDRVGDSTGRVKTI